MVKVHVTGTSAREGTNREAVDGLLGAAAVAVGETDKIIDAIRHLENIEVKQLLL